MFKLLSGKNKCKGDGDGEVDLDNKPKSIIQDMSSDSEDSSSPIATSQPSEVSNVSSKDVQIDNVLTNGPVNTEITDSDSGKKMPKIKTAAKKAAKPPKTAKGSKVSKAPIKKALSDTSDSSEDDSSSDESIVLPPKGKAEDSDSSYSEDDSSSDSDESDDIIPLKPTKPIKTNTKVKSEANGINGGKKNKMSLDENTIPKKKIRLSEAKNASMKKGMSSVLLNYQFICEIACLMLAHFMFVFYLWLIG